MVRFKIGTKPYKIAEKWAELTDKQLLATLPFLYADSKSIEVRFRLMAVLVPELKKKVMLKLSAEQMYDLMALNAWVWQLPLTTEKVSSFEHNGKTYLLPKPQLDDMIAVEFAMSDLFLRDFTDSSDPKFLHLLAATICRPAKPGKEIKSTSWDGIERERYNGAIAEKRALEMAGLPIEKKILVLQHFVEQKKFVHESYDIFSAGGSGSGGGFDIGWLSLIFDLAEQGTFGDFDKVSYTNMNTLCLYLHNKRQNRNDE